MLEKNQVEIKKEGIDKVIPILGLLVVMGSFIYVFVFYKQLPDEIPIHYGLDGMPDDFDSKNTLWSLPLLSLFIYLGINYLSNIHIPYNFAAKNIVQNARYLKKLKYRFVQVLNTIITFIFFYITYKTVQIGLENDTGLGSYFMYLVFVGLLVPITVYTLIFFRKAF